MCGTGVRSAIMVTFNPSDWTARMADSRPGPGPLTYNSTSWIPMVMAAFIACSAAIRAAKGVLLREPLKPAEPALPQARAFPCWSVTVTMVLLKEAKTCTCPADKNSLGLLGHAGLTAYRSYTLCHTTSLIRTFLISPGIPLAAGPWLSLGAAGGRSQPEKLEENRQAQAIFRLVISYHPYGGHDRQRSSWDLCECASLCAYAGREPVNFGGGAGHGKSQFQSVA